MDAEGVPDVDVDRVGRGRQTDLDGVHVQRGAQTPPPGLPRARG
ncbi:hypothetical protein [Tabrizicola thermarum]|nr:hypothetical protein [Tabrizicola thermarum]